MRGYIRNEEILRGLPDVELRRGVNYIPENMRIRYDKLLKMAIVAKEDLALLDTRLTDLAAIARSFNTTK